MVNDTNKKLNPEQLEAIQHGDGPLLIIAGAGTGKTTVVTERVRHLILKKQVLPSEILALTFTEKAAREMEERIDRALPYGYTQMWILTFHSFCDRVLRRDAAHIGLNPNYKLTSDAQITQFLRKNLFKLDLEYFRPLGNPTKFIGGMLGHFARLMDEDIFPEEYLSWAESKNKKAESLEEKSEAKKWLELAQAFKLYEEIKIKEGLMDFGNLITNTLKLFRERPNVLGEYQNQFKYILVDEFQDTNYAQNQLALLLAAKHKNITVCGDDDQCLPPNSQIATPTGLKRIKDFKPGDKVITAVGKGHTSISMVIKIFRNTKERRLLTYKLEDGKKVTVTDNHKMFCFLPSSVKSNGQSYVYLMRHQNLGWRVGTTNNLPARLKFERQTDGILAIGYYNSMQEARFYEAYFSSKYGLPTVAFTPRPSQVIEGLWLKRLFKEVDTESNVKLLANDLHLELNAPQFSLGGVTRGESRRVKINLLMCHRNYRGKSSNGFLANPGVGHLVYIETSNLRIINLLERNGFRCHKAKKGKRFRFETSDLSEAWRVADKLVEITGGVLDKKFVVGRFNYQHLPARIVPASHVLPGMYLPVLEGKKIVYKKVLARKEKKKRVTTYDLEVERTHNFIANGVVVHNSIYRFRGAAASNIIQFRKTYPEAKIVVLTKNYRTAQSILDKAYNLIQFNNPDRLEVVEKVNKKLISQRKIKGQIRFIHKDRVENEGDEVARKVIELRKEGYDYRDFAVLVRANNHAEPFVRAFQRMGVPSQFLGPGRLFKQPEIVDLISYLKVLYNFEDSISFYRLLSIDFLGIPSKDLIRVGNYAKRLNLSLYETCEKIDDIYVDVKTKEKIKNLIAIIEGQLKIVKKETAGQLLYNFLEESKLIDLLLHPDSSGAQKRAGNISKFFDKLKTYEVENEDSTVPAVTDWIELSMELGESPLAADTDWTEINAVNILTVHSAKGLEFPVVFLVNLVSQRFPSTERREQIPISEEVIKEVLPQGDYHLQEERRLFYVGMTRARDILFLTASNYYGEGKRDKKLSPFIFETLGDELPGAEKEDDKSKQLSFLDFSHHASEDNKENNDRLHIDYLSYSQLDTFKVCPMHYKLKYILKIPTPPNASLSFGSSVHAALKDFYLSIKAGEKPTQDLLLTSLKRTWIREGYTSRAHEEKMIDLGKRYFSEFFEKFDIKVLPAALEQQFTLPLRNGSDWVRIGGKIDRVDVLPDGRIEIVDYKTGANVPTQKEVDNDLQLTFYALAATNMREVPFNRKPEEVIYSLYYFEEQKKITTLRTKEQLDSAIDEIFKIKEEIEISDFKCGNGFLCGNCEYKFLCSSG